MTTSRALADLFDAFERDAFRLETLDDYSRSGNTDAYETSGGRAPTARPQRGLGLRAPRPHHPRVHVRDRLGASGPDRCP